MTLTPRPSDVLSAAECKRIDAMAHEQFLCNPPPPPTPAQLAMTEAILGPAIQRRIAQRTGEAA